MVELLLSLLKLLGWLLLLWIVVFLPWAILSDWASDDNDGKSIDGERPSRDCGDSGDFDWDGY